MRFLAPRGYPFHKCSSARKQDSFVPGRTREFRASTFSISIGGQGLRCKNIYCNKRKNSSRLKVKGKGCALNKIRKADTSETSNVVLDYVFERKTDLPSPLMAKAGGETWSQEESLSPI